eukprot:snap_masked-scaffold_21-processed-gene-2.9-mRNA-1 protein AED:1.00 eAED:1.00 QI:0/-1/0/0/-1/1/1/0/259
MESQVEENNKEEKKVEETVKHIKLDLSHLSEQSLKKYAWTYNLDTSVSKEQLGFLCTQHFNSVKLSETQQTKHQEQLLDYYEQTPVYQRCEIPHFAQETEPEQDLDDAEMDEIENPVEEETKEGVDVHAEGRVVAAKVGSDWLVTTVLKYDDDTKCYELQDADELEENPRVFSISHDMVIPFSMKGSHARRRGKNDRVLAVFPNTSSLYAATVVKLEKKKGEDGDIEVEYGLRFDDDEKDENDEVKVRNVNSLQIVDLP